MPTKPRNACPRCRRVACTCGYQTSQGERISAARRGYDYEWQQTRKAFLAANPWCVDCLPEIVPATEPHHVVPKPVGSDDWSNLLPLCKAHHSVRTGRRA